MNRTQRPRSGLTSHPGAGVPRLCGLATLFATLFLAASAASAAEPATIAIDVAKPGHAVPTTLWGIFFEEISHAGEGGLYAEMVRNRDFEASVVPAGWHVDGTHVSTPRGWRTRLWFTNDLPGWSQVEDGGAEGQIALDSSSPLNDRNPHSLRITVTKRGARCGVANSGFWGMNFQAGQWYDLTFYARTERNRHFGLIVSLESIDGKEVCERETLPEVGGRWRKYTLSLHARQSDPKGRLVITLSDPGTIWLDVVSLFPRHTFRNRPNGMRPDLAQMLVGLHPAFLRFPGGCVVEGCTMANRFRWQDSIGDIAQRKGGFDLWGYYTTYGLGFQEYLQLAEDLGAEPVYVINSGMSCQARRPNETVSDADLHRYVQDSLDALEYAMGPVTSKWGALRAANGHPAPFPIKYVEIGNENHGPAYLKHYKIYYDAIKAKYPHIITIADTRLRDAPVEYVDDHFYVRPARFFHMWDYFDDVPRNGPKIYVGEYAVNRGVGHGNLFGALAEAVFMLDMEKNSDLVKMCSYAPLFENVNQPDWPVNLIRFDSSRCVGRSSYQVQKLFAENRPDVVLPTRVTAPEVSARDIRVHEFYALAGLDERRHEVVLKVVNPTATPVAASIDLRGVTRVTAPGTIFTLGNANATAENTLDHPNFVVPVKSVYPAPDPEFTYHFTPNSLTVLRLPVAMR